MTGPRHLVKPDGIVSTAFPAFQREATKMGVTYDPWQVDLNRAVLAKRADGRWAARTVLISIPRQTGKALPLDTPVLTPNGYVSNGDLKVGDYVYHPDGHATQVVGKSPVMHDHDVYRVALTDGRHLDTDADHLWTVKDTRKGGEWVDMTTQEILDAGLYRGSATRTVVIDGKEYQTHEYRFQLPGQGVVRLPRRELPIDPYLLGAWLGNGTRTNGSLTMHEDDMAHFDARLAAAGWTRGDLYRNGESRGVTFTVYGLVGALRALGVLDDKHVPEEYLTASADQRLALLQGLLDTDATITPKGAVEFCSKDFALSDAVAILARSFGWKVGTSSDSAKLYGKDCGLRHRVRLTPDTGDGFNPFSLERKAARVKASSRRGTKTVSIKAIEQVESVPVQCIRVESPDGLYLAGRHLVPTHNTFDVASLCIEDCLLRPGITVVWSAHHFKVAREAFALMRSLVSTPGMAQHVADITTANGNECILFRNGSRIVFAARQNGSIRGFSKVNRLILDEAQELQDHLLSDMAPTMNQAENPQTILMCTPPSPKHHGDVVIGMRASALSGKSKGLLFVEYSAPADCDIYDDTAVAEANPSYPLRTNQDAIDTLRELLTNDDDFRREALGQWDTSKATKLYPPDLWDRAEDPDSVPVDRFSIGIEVSPDLVGASVVMAGQRADGDWHVELDDSRSGTDWVVPYVKDLLADNPQIRSVVVDAGSPAKALVEDFKKAHIKVTYPKVAEIGSACSQLLSGIVTRQVHHIGQWQLTQASQGVGRRKLGDTGLWTHSRATATSDATPIQAAALALFGSQSDAVRRPARTSVGRTGRSRSSGGRVATVS